MVHSSHQPVKTTGVSLIVVVLAQGLAALGLGIALAVGLAEIGWRLFAGEPSGLGDIVARVLGLITGYPLGVAIAVPLVGRLLQRPGAVWAAILGSLAGSGAVLLAARVGLQSETVLMWSLFLSLGLITSIAAYHLAPLRRQGRE